MRPPAWYEPARLFLTGFVGLLFAVLACALFNADEGVIWDQFLRGQVGFECFGMFWFWKLLVLVTIGCVIGAAAGRFL